MDPERAGASSRWCEGRWDKGGIGEDCERDGRFRCYWAGRTMCRDVILRRCLYLSEARDDWEEEESYACKSGFIIPKVDGVLLTYLQTGSERLIWGQGQPSSLRAVTTTIKGVKLTLASAICWENYMPLLRQSLYSQNVNLYLAPTADGRDTWLPLMRTIATEGRCVVLSANQCMTRSNLPSWITGVEEHTALNGKHVLDGSSRPSRIRRKSTITVDGHEIILPESKETSRLRRESTITEDGHEIIFSEGKPPPRLRRRSTITVDGNEIALPESKPPNESLEEPQRKPQPDEFISHGGSCIVSPMGDVLAGPLWDDENGLLFVDVDFEDCLRGRLDIDVGGSYSR